MPNYNYQDDSPKIICPFCFEKFDQHEAVFRASRGFDQRELGEADEEDMGGLLAGRGKGGKDTKDIRRLFQKFDLEQIDANSKVDEKLMAYWKDRGGSDGFIYDDKDWNLPHIEFANRDVFDRMVRKEEVAGVKPDAEGFVRDGEEKDRDRFIYGVLDQYSGNEATKVRLCPHCHNPLPLVTYGKHPVLFIGVIGMTSSGKTVYLNQLLNDMSGALYGTGYEEKDSNLNKFGAAMTRSKPLPGSTDAGIVRRPLAVNLEPKERNSFIKPVTLVFYDIAGELCVNPNGDEDLEQAQNTIGKHIAHCDGLIFLIDPEQIPVFATGDLDLHAIQNVVRVVNQIRSRSMKREDAWDEVPVALCVTKSDKLRGNPNIPQGLPVFRNADQKEMGFDWESNKQIHMFLRKLMRSQAFSVYTAVESFNTRAYFMVSAINCGAECRVEKYKNWYVLSDRNVQKFRRLQSWVKGWNERLPQERPYYRPCPVMTEAGEPIAFPVEEKITEENAKELMTEISGVTSYGNEIHLTLWDVVNDLNLVSFPKNDPQQFRVFEPLRWILWKRGMVGPLEDYPEEPEKRPFESKRHFEARYKEYEALCAEQDQMFIWDEKYQD